MQVMLGVSLRARWDATLSKVVGPNGRQASQPAVRVPGDRDIPVVRF